MNYFKIIAKFSFIILIILPCLANAQQGNGTVKKPNIVIIISDDHAYQSISAYGSKFIKTPNIDRIAKEGAIMNKAYVTNSICGPSRAVILTGKYSHKNGFLDNEHSRFDGSQGSFVKELRANGYLTSWIGKWHLETEPQGFDYWQILPGQGSYYNPDFIMMDGKEKRVDGYATNVIEEQSEKWLDSRDTTKPFCLVIGHKATHRTWIPDTTDLGKFDKVKFPLPSDFYDNYKTREAAKIQEMTISKTMIMGYDLKMFANDEEESKEGTFKRMNPDQRKRIDEYYKPIYADLQKQNLSGNALTEWKFQRYMKDYLSSSLSLDRNIGKTLDYLDKHNLTENTIVIYMSDQGFYLGEHGWFDKRFMYEESFRTPMVIRFPGKIKPNTKSDAMVLNLDIAPTVLDAAGVKIPQEMQGKSMLPVLENKNAEKRKSLYYHYYENGEHAVSPHFGVKTKRYKLIKFYTRVNSWELFDLQKDPQELHNLYLDPKYKDVVKTLRAELMKLVLQYEDKDAEKIIKKDNDAS